MRKRTVVLLGLSLAFAAAAMAVADHIAVTPATMAPAVRETAAPVEPSPATPAHRQAAIDDKARELIEAARQPAAPQPSIPKSVASKPAAPVVTIAPAAPPPAALPEPEPVASPAPAAAAPPSSTVPPVAVQPPAVTLPPAETPRAVEAPPADKAPAIVALAPPVDATPPTTVAPADPVVTLPELEPAPLPPEKPEFVEPKKETVAAKALFSAEKLPSLGKAMAIGYYPRGCLSGGVALPANGPTWQVMRLSRNRNWGHPSLIRFLERFAPAAAKATGWNGILVGDMAQPRGGPTPFGHMSHQTGLDVDVWFMPMPNRVLTAEEREKTSAINLVSADWKSINPKTWTPQQIAFIRTAAEQPEVERVLVNAAIKKEICRIEGKKPDAWMSKVRPWYGHHDHIHVRLKCPADSPNCRKQPPVPADDGCGKELDYWFSDKVLNPPKPAKPAKPPRPITMADLPPACRTVLAAPSREQKQASGN